MKKNLAGSRKKLVDTFRVCYMDFMLKKTHIFYYIIIFLIFLAHCGAGRTCYSDIESFIMAEINVFDCHLYVQSLLMA